MLERIFYASMGSDGGFDMRNQLNTYTCLLDSCGWTWASRLPLPPKYCARCKRQNWDQPRPPRQQALSVPPKPKKIYPFHTLEVGQSIQIGWEIGKDGLADPRAANNLGRAVRQEEARYGKKFRREPSPAGLKITRLV